MPAIIIVIGIALFIAGLAVTRFSGAKKYSRKSALVVVALVAAGVGLVVYGLELRDHNRLETKRQAVIAKDRASIRIIQGAEQSYYRAHKQYTVSVGDLVAEGPEVARTIIDGQPAGLKLLPVNGLSGVNIQFGSYIYDGAYVEVPANFSIVLKSGRELSFTCVGEKKVCRGVEGSK